MEALVGVQRASGWTDAAMAERLGVSQPYWTMVRHGQRTPGGKLLAGVETAFPQFREAVSLFLRHRFTTVSRATHATGGG